MTWLVAYVILATALCGAETPATVAESNVSESGPTVCAEELALCKRSAHVTRALTESEGAVLDTHFWDEWVGDSVAVWVSVDEQVFRIIKNRGVIWEARCATAEKGTGFVMNSMQTPLGWHSVKRKVGDGAPWGQVFRGAQPVNQVWKPGDQTDEDLVLTRLLWLTGEEPGVNQGGEVDSYNRYIYIHGTNDEEKIGTPSSHGCVRLRNDDVIEAYKLIPKDARVLITETAKPAE